MNTVTRGARNVFRNPVRLVLVVILLGTSLMFVAAMIALNGSAQARVAAVQSQVGVNIDIWDPGATPLTTDLTRQQVRQAEQTPGVIRFVERFGTLYNGYELQPLPRAPGVFVYGSSSGTNLLAKGGAMVHVTAGRTFTAAEENASVAIMGTALARANHLRLGARFPLEGTTLRLIGLYATGTSMGDDGLMLPTRTALRVFQAPAVTWITVYARNAAEVPALAHALRGRLNSHIDIATHEDQVSGTLAALSTIQHNSMSALIAALLAAALIIVVAIALTVRERTQEIGVLKAIGASTGQVVRQFAVEALSLSGVAAVAGALLLLLAGGRIARAFDLTPASSSAGGPSPAGGQHLLVALTPQTLLVVLGVGVLLAVVASVIPTWAVARIKPAQVLRMA